MPSTFFESLTPKQQEKINHSGECGGCARYLGKTEKGEHTYWWHDCASEGYTVLPIGDYSPDFDGSIFTCVNNVRQEWTIDGEDLTLPFSYLCHVDTRKLEGLEEDINKGSYLPEHAAKRLGLEAGVSIEWIGHLWITPYELTKSFMQAVLALTLVYPDGRRVVII